MYARRSALAVFGLGVVGMLALLVVAQTQPGETPPIIPVPDFRQVPAEPVARIVDGDTIAVLRGGQEVKVRLIGIDTPETVHPSKPVEAYGKEASRFTANLLKGEKVYLVRDPTSASTVDRYGRLLAFVYRAPDGLFVNAEIVRQGYGRAYVQHPFRYMEEFCALERFAKEAGKGLWDQSDCKAGGQAPRLMDSNIYPVLPLQSVVGTCGVRHGWVPLLRFCERLFA